MRRALRRDDRGATIVEFALVAPMLMFGLFGMIEGGRSMWMRQALQQTAYASARCLALNTAASCSNATTVKTYAVNHARRAGVRVTTAQVASARGVACNTMANMSRVQMTVPFNSAAGTFIPDRYRTMRVSACFPNPS